MISRGIRGWSGLIAFIAGALVGCTSHEREGEPVGKLSAALQPDEQADGSVLVEADGPFEAQLVFSKAAFRNLAVLTSPSTPAITAHTCTVNGTTVTSCLFDTQACSNQCPVENGDFTCTCLQGDVRDLGAVTAGSSLAQQLLSDTDRNGTIDQTWFSDESLNADDQLDHLLTTKLLPGTWLFEWEDKERSISDFDYNDMAYLIRSVPPGFPPRGAATPCNYNGPSGRRCPGTDVAYLSKLDIEPLGTPDRHLILTIVALNFGSQEQELAICPMLNIPENFAALGPRPSCCPSCSASCLGSCSTTDRARCERYDPQHYLFRSGDGLPDCDTGRAPHPHGSIRFSNHMQVGAPACPIPAPPSGTPDDVIAVPRALGGSAGRQDYVRSIRIADLDNRLLADDRLGSLTSEQIRDRISKPEGHFVQLYTDIFFDFGHRPFICPNGFVTSFGEGPGGPAVASDVGNVVWTWNNLTTAQVLSPVSVLTELSNAVVMGPGGVDTPVFLDVFWEDNLATHLRGHVRTVFESAPGSPELRVREPFTLFGGDMNLGRVDFDLPNDLPNEFLGRATLVVYYQSTREVLVSSVIHLAKDDAAPELLQARTTRSASDLRVDITARDPAPGIQEALALPTVAGSDGLPFLLRYVDGDLTSATTFAGVTSIPAIERVSMRTQISDDFKHLTAATIPVAHAGLDRDVECTSPAGTAVQLDGSLSTNDAAFPLSFMWTGSFGTATGVSPIVDLGLGEHPIALRVVDARAFEGTTGVTINVADTTAPTISDIIANPSCLWPPNHKLVAYELGGNVQVSASDACDLEPVVRVIDVQSSEPDTDGRPDAVFGPNGFCLRAERSSSGAGREYRVTFEAVDATGNRSTEVLTIVVPHDRRSAACPPIPPSMFVGDEDPRCQ